MIYKALELGFCIYPLYSFTWKFSTCDPWRAFEAPADSGVCAHVLWCLFLCAWPGAPARQPLGVLAEMQILGPSLVARPRNPHFNMLLMADERAEKQRKRIKAIIK